MSGRGWVCPSGSLSAAPRAAAGAAGSTCCPSAPPAVLLPARPEHASLNRWTVFSTSRSLMSACCRGGSPAAGSAQDLRRLGAAHTVQQVHAAAGVSCSRRAALTRDLTRHQTRLVSTFIAAAHTSSSESRALRRSRLASGLPLPGAERRAGCGALAPTHPQATTSPSGAAASKACSRSTRVAWGPREVAQGFRVGGVWVRPGLASRSPAWRLLRLLPHSIGGAPSAMPWSPSPPRTKGPFGGS